MLHIVEKLGEKKLKYWSFSYGAFLGVTFASLWPEKVGRIFLDGMYHPRLPGSYENSLLALQAISTKNNILPLKALIS
jgi:pimeloyl-ACP methyl ester carboxylesterase